jgi:hypothetical protein
MRRLRSALAVLVVLMLPGVAQAQTSASINGVVRDTQGGVVPGVTVEAASRSHRESPILDHGRGGTLRHRDLRPGTFS